MNDTGIILAEDSNEGIGALKVSKPLTLVYGKPLIIHMINRMQEAGIEEIMIMTDPDNAAIKNTISGHPEITATLSFMASSDRKSLPWHIEEITSRSRKGVFVAGCDLVFEQNPLLLFSRKGPVEMLVDKNLEHNRFCGAEYKLKTSFRKYSAFSRGLQDHNAYCAGVYWVSPEGNRKFWRHAGHDTSAKTMEDMLETGAGIEHVRLVNMPQMLWYDVNAPDTLMRSEMLLRRSHVSDRPTDVHIDKLKSISTPIDFSYTKSLTTQVLIERGLLHRISKYAIMDPVRTSSHHIIITDETVNKLFGDLVLRQLQDAGYKVTKFVAPVGEGAKSMGIYNQLAEKITAAGIDERSIIFSLGGGVMANLAGFLAATLYRGIGLVHIPTSFMCMNDVAVSLKQGINNQNGKNLVGSYYQPLLVLIDPAISMPDELVRHGISESAKHALGQDKDFFDELVEYNGPLDDVDFRERVIKRTIELKVDLMHEDMFENSRGIILQYGHEVGHALEYLSKFNLTHGEAISIGMRVSAELAYLMSVTGKETVDDHKRILANYDLPYVIPKDIKQQDIVDALRFNKKTRGTDIRFALLEYTGRAWKIKGEYGIPCPTEFIGKAVSQSYNA